MRRFSGDGTTRPEEIGGGAREGCRIIIRLIGPAGNSLSIGKVCSTPDADRLGIAGISASCSRAQIPADQCSDVEATSPPTPRRHPCVGAAHQGAAMSGLHDRRGERDPDLRAMRCCACDLVLSLTGTQGLQAVLSICRECADRECPPAARARGGAHLPALSGPLTFVAARRSTGDKVTCETLPVAAMTR